MAADGKAAESESSEGHDWKIVEAGPEGVPSWGGWWECTRCGEGTRRVTPSKDQRVYDGLFTCEEMIAHAAREAAREAKVSS